MRAAIYARVSTPEQAADGHGLESQIAACQAHASEHGYQVVAIYREVRTGGDLVGRKQLSELRTRVRSGEIDVVITHAIDRLTRNVAHLHFLITEAEAAGATIAFVVEELVDTPEGKLLQAVRGFVAELERLKSGERSRLGIRTRVERGQYHVGSIPYGYHWRDSSHAALVADAASAPIIARIFAEVASGSSIGQVIKGLDGDGIPTPRQSPLGWNERTISDILRNPIYKGMPHAYRWRKKVRGDLDQLIGGGREDWEPAPMADWVSLPAEVAPALVSIDDWTLANTWRVANRSNSTVDHPLPETFLLAGGLARCGVCGRPLLGRGRTAHRPIYRCAGRRSDQRPCDRARSVASVLDERVWTRILRTAAKGGPALGRRSGTAGKLVWIDDGSASEVPDLPPLGSISSRCLGNSDRITPKPGHWGRSATSSLVSARSQTSAPFRTASR